MYYGNNRYGIGRYGREINNKTAVNAALKYKVIKLYVKVKREDELRI